MQATTNSALAAIAGFDANLLLAAQSIAKLEHAIISRNTPLLICRRASASSTCPTAIRRRFSRARPRSIAALRHGKPSRPAPNRRRYRPRESEVVLCSVLG